MKHVTDTGWPSWSLKLHVNLYCSALIFFTGHHWEGKRGVGVGGQPHLVCRRVTKFKILVSYLKCTKMLKQLPLR